MQPKSKHKITTLTGIAIVVANMIGTGAFNSLGFQLKDLNNPSVVLTLWVLGGILALSGAFSYAEVGTVISKIRRRICFLVQNLQSFNRISFGMDFAYRWFCGTDCFSCDCFFGVFSIWEFQCQMDEYCFGRCHHINPYPKFETECRISKHQYFAQSNFDCNNHQYWFGFTGTFGK